MTRTEPFTARPDGARTRIFLILAGATVLGFAGTDLILPAIPLLPEALGGNPAQAQLVLAAFTGGMAAGLLLFGTLTARFGSDRLLLASLIAYAGLSLLCAVSAAMPQLIALRFVQGVASAAAGVLAPGILRQLYGASAVTALGAIGAIESLAPALAPILGWSLLPWTGWRGGFLLIAAVALLLAAGVWRNARRMPGPDGGGAGSYAALFARPAFLWLAFSHAATVAALLTFVFAAPAVFTRVLGWPLGVFIAMQAIGVALFIVTSVLSGRMAARLGPGRVIRIGAASAFVGGIGLFLYASAGGTNPAVVIAIFVLLNAGLGLRGPVGFHLALTAAGDDGRGAALIVLAMLALPAIGTALIAPWIMAGLVPVTGACAVLAVAALLATGPGLRRLS